MQRKAYLYARFSTPEQKKGDTLRRQEERAEEWIKAHDYILDDTLRDEGLSAYKGEHKTKGKLGRFLKLIEAGKIEPGAVLIVEDMDRLSREQIMDALTQFISIIKAGIQVDTVKDGKSFTEQSINQNPFDLMYSIMNMTLAHQESEEKSYHLKQTWEKKRNNIDEKKLTKRCPAWLELSKDGKRYLPIPDRCDVIKKIFRMKGEGQSPYAIEKRLNTTPGNWKPERKNASKGKPGKGRKSGGKIGWRKSYIQKILRNPAVIGEFQPHRHVDGKRQPVGDPKPNYYPEIVNPGLFYQVQEKIKANRETFKGGVTGKVSNLFSYLTKCGYCGGSMYHVNKGKPPKGGSYLICDNAKRKNGCKSSSPWRYDEFESDLIQHICYKIDVSTLLPDHDETEREIDTLNRELASIRGQLSKAESKINNLTNSISTTKDKRIRELLQNKLTGILDEKERLEKEGKETEDKTNTLERSGNNLQERIENMKELMAYLKRAKPSEVSEEVSEIRLKLREALRGAIDEIKLFSRGFRDRKHVNEYESTPDRRKVFYEGIDNKDWRFYRLGLKGCRFTRAVYAPWIVQKLKGID